MSLAQVTRVDINCDPPAGSKYVGEKIKRLARADR